MPANAAEYRDQVVEISRLAVNSNVLEGITFVNCQIVGPAVLLPLEDVSIVESGWDAPGLEAIMWIIPEGRTQVIGAIGLNRCTFSACTFREIGLAVPEARVDEMRSGFGS